MKDKIQFWSHVKKSFELHARVNYESFDLIHFVIYIMTVRRHYCCYVYIKNDELFHFVYIRSNIKSNRNIYGKKIYHPKQNEESRSNNTMFNS